MVDTQGIQLICNRY